MYPIHSENYILSKESFGSFTIAQNKAALDKNKRNLRITSIIQVAVGTIFILAMIITKQTTGVIWFVLAGVLIVVGFFGKTRISGYDKKVNETIERNYNERHYGENMFNVKFFDDKLTYSVGDQKGNLPYKSFAKSYDQQNFYAMHFYTGEVIIFNKSCDIEKIKQIISDYKSAHPDEVYDPYENENQEIENGLLQDIKTNDEQDQKTEIQDQETETQLNQDEDEDEVAKQ